MADGHLRGVTKSFGPVHVIKGVDLAIEPSEFVVFVGPSGCGKSTLLRLIAGLEDITSGELMIDGEVVNDLPPSERGIAMVFQSYALYPHMTVYDNMAFGLKLRRRRQGRATSGSANAARILQITPSSTASPSSSPAASASASPSAAPSSATRASSCSTSRSPTSTRRCASRCASRSPSSTTHARRDHDLRHPRPGRGDDAGRPIVVLDAGIVEQFGAPLELYHHPPTCSSPASSARRR